MKYELTKKPVERFCHRAP